MKKNQSWTSIIEAIVAMMIIVIWIVWVYTIYDKSMKFSNAIENRIIAISIAREWIEVTQNIRDTNWIIFWADTRNCWNTYNYNVNCVASNAVSNKIWSWNYTIYKDTDNRWKYQTWATLWNYSNPAYRSAYRVLLDTDWLYSQSWWISFIPIFTRQLIISYPEDTNASTTFDANDEKMLVKSIVSWKDWAKEEFSTVTLENILTNWKKN